MSRINDRYLDELWLRHHSEWRHPAQVISHWKESAEVDPRVLQYLVYGEWWDILERLKLTLLVTREYEHLVMGISVVNGKRKVSYMRIPHPSGLVVDRQRHKVYIASTRNPNQVFDFFPASTVLKRFDIGMDEHDENPLLPSRSRFYPGCLYLHDLALIDGGLYGNAVGQNAVIRILDDTGYKRIWWPRCIEKRGVPVFEQNHIQLNSIASSSKINNSYFTASSEIVSTRRPGHKNFVVDKRGVIFSGKSREPVVRGLTRPHSARLHTNTLWVANSGYGEFGYADIKNEVFRPIIKLPGWTRGVCIQNDIAFIGVSRVIPQFSFYAPGLKVKHTICGVCAVETKTGKVKGSFIWPHGNQIFAIDWIPSNLTAGFAFSSRGEHKKGRKIFYYFNLPGGANV